MDQEDLRKEALARSTAEKNLMRVLAQLQETKQVEGPFVSSTPAVTIIAGADHPEDARRQCEVKARDWASGAEESAQVQRGGIALSHSLG